MRAWGIAALPALLLAGCGGGAEDFTVAIKRPLATVYAPLSAANAGVARMAFPGIGFERSRPSETEILYTIPGTGSFPATVRLRLEPRREGGGETTVVHATVKAPKVRAVIDGEPKELSEWKIERQLEKVLQATGRSLEMGSSAQAETEKLSGLLVAVAVATNEKHLASALDLKAHPEKLAELLRTFATPGEQPPPRVEGRDIRTVNPDAGQIAHETAQAQAEWKREQALEQAAAPTSNLDRYDR